MDPLIATLQGQASRSHAQPSVRGLLADVERKNVEAIADHFGQDRLGFQRCIGGEGWKKPPLRHTLCDPVGQQVGQADDGGRVFAPTTAT